MNSVKKAVIQTGTPESDFKQYFLRIYFKVFEPGHKKRVFKNQCWFYQ